MKNNAKLIFIAIASAASCYGAFAQTPVPLTFTSLNEIELAKRCYYIGDMTGRLTFRIWQGKNNKNATNNLLNTVMVTEVWRSKFKAPDSDEMVITMENMNIEPPDKQHAQYTYCTEIGRKYYELMTSSQQKSLLDKALKRVGGYKAEQQ